MKRARSARMLGLRRAVGLSVLMAAVCLVGPATAGAGVAYDYTTMTNQPGGSAFSAGVGHQFTPGQPMVVNSLGFAAWEGTQTGVMPAGAPPVTVQLYDYDAITPNNSILLATAVFPAGTASTRTFDPGPPGAYLAYEWQSALAAPVALSVGKDYLVAAYGFNGIGGNEVQYLNGPTGVTVAPNISHNRSHYNSGGRGVNDAPNVPDVPGPQYAGPTFEYQQTAARKLGYDSTGLTSTGAGSGYSAGVGLHFMPTQDVALTTMGTAAWVESTIPAGNPVTVQLYNVSDGGGPLATVTFDGSDVGSRIPGLPFNGRLFLADTSAPLVLHAGKEYAVVGYGYNDTVAGQKVHYLQPTFTPPLPVAGEISHLGSRYGAGGVGTVTTAWDGKAPKYVGPTFQFENVAEASKLAYDFTTMTNAPAGSSFSSGVGLGFVPDKKIMLDSLGFAAWVQNGAIPASNPVTVQLFKSSDVSTALATAVFDENSGGATFVPDGGSYFAMLFTAGVDPVLLNAGEQYLVAAYGFNQQVQYLNGPLGVSIAPDITHVGSWWGTGGVGNGPTNFDNAGTQYGGPTFTYKVVPEPATLALLGLAVTGLGGYIRRRRAA